MCGPAHLGMPSPSANQGRLLMAQHDSGSALALVRHQRQQALHWCLSLSAWAVRASCSSADTAVG